MFAGYRGIVFIICATAALGGLLFGLDQGFIANSIGTIKDVYSLDTVGEESYSSILATGGIVGALLSGIFARILGRKKSLVLAGFLFTLASATSAILPPFRIMMILRFLIGFAVGIASFVVPLYLSETAPTKIRGSMGTLFQLMITIGIFLISLTNVFIAKLISTPASALPLMFAVIVVFALLMFIGSIFLPESPRWLMLKGKKEAAQKILRRVMNAEEEVAAEIIEIERTLASGTGSLKTLFKKYFLKILLVGILLQMFQQLVGINVMIYYAPTIFGFAGMTGFIAMMTVPTVNMLFTFPAIRLVEKWGRKKLLYVGAVAMIVSMLAAGIAFSIIGGHGGHDAAAIATGPKVVLLIAVIIYIFGFAVSWGPVAWLICSEIFPLKGREIGMTVTTMVNWTFAGLLMRYSLSFMEDHGNASIFFLFSAFCAMAIIFVAIFVPETRGTTLEKIEENLKAGKKLRHLGQS